MGPSSRKVYYGRFQADLSLIHRSTRDVGAEAKCYAGGEMMRHTGTGSRSMMIALGALTLGCGMDPSLPVYTTEQTDSAHAGYRRTTVSTQGAVYVNDFEEAALQLSNPDPTEVVGRSQFGNGKICAIPGQSPSAYLAVDVGSEMPAYEVFRSLTHPPFDWRQAAFQKMRLAVPDGPTANRETTDPALIDDVVRTLREAMPVAPSEAPPPMPLAASATRVHAILLFSDQLPGLVFRPSLYRDESGHVYLAEGLMVEYTPGKEPTVQAAWIPASPLLTRWVQTP